MRVLDGECLRYVGRSRAKFMAINADRCNEFRAFGPFDNERPRTTITLKGTRLLLQLLRRASLEERKAAQRLQIIFFLRSGFVRRREVR